jgi:hypothetical protein
VDKDPGSPKMAPEKHEKIAISRYEDLFCCLDGRMLKKSFMEQEMKSIF